MCIVWFVSSIELRMFKPGSIVRARKNYYALVAYDDLEHQQRKSPKIVRYATWNETFTVIKFVRVKVKGWSYARLQDSLYVLDTTGRLCTVQPGSVVKLA